ncbi:MAG: hypothetical protein IJT44_09955 [Clostridia bacterium]|nr:hypothetical protein [Clostridia bacterium]
MKKRSLCLFLALLLMLAACPIVSAQTAQVTIEGLHDAQIRSAALYRLADGSPAGSDLLSGVAAEPVGYEYVYHVSLPDGVYWLEGFDENGDNNGGVSFTVDAKQENTFRVQRIYDLHAGNSGWIEGTDYTIDVTVSAPDGQERRIAFGKAADYNGTRFTSCLFFVGDTLDVTFTPIGDKAADYLPSTVSEKPKLNRSITETIYEGLSLTFLAPAGSTVSAGAFSNYYVYRFFEPTKTAETQDGRVRTSFRIPKRRAGNTTGTNFFYRVQNPVGVTYWNYFDPTALKSDTIEITPEMIYLANDSVDSKTVIRDFRYNTYDKADIYLGGSKQGYVPLKTGETFELNTFRNWMAIESIYNAKVSLPDTHYAVVDMNGKSSDVLTVTPDKQNSCVAAVKANKAGTAIVLVTYDAMFAAQAYVSGKAGQSCLFSAIWPENTGVLVFSVDADGSAIETGMMLGGVGAGYEIDAEHDPLFYTGSEGAEYTFTPESGCTVSVNRSIVTNAMTFGGFSTDGVRQNADGSVTVSGLTTGKHIVKVEKNGLATYQVLTAKQTSYTFSNDNIRAGDTVTIRFSGLVNPVEKMSGIYNNSATIRYAAPDGKVFVSQPGGAYGVYDFSGNPERQQLTVTIPRYYAGDVYTLSGGSIAMRLSGSAPGSHRGVSYGQGVDPGFNAQSSGALQGKLPDIPITLGKADFLTATLRLTDGKGKPIDLDGLTVTLRDADGFETAVRPDGTFLCYAGEYTYAVSGEGVEDAQGTFTVTDGGEIALVLTRTAKPSRFMQMLEKIGAFFGKAWAAISLPFRLLVEWVRKLFKK